MKKVISLLLILCLTLSLAACGGPKSQPGTPSTTQSSLQASQPDFQTEPDTEAPEEGDYYSLANGVTAQFMEAPTPGTEPTVPEETQKIGSEGCAPNIWPTLLNCGDPEVIKSKDKFTSAIVYPHTEGPIQAKVDFSRYIDPKNLPAEDYSFIFMILADGVPMEFTVESTYQSDNPQNDESIDLTEDGQRYLQYPLSVGEKYVTLNLEFEPEFDLNLGRLDFITLFTGNDNWDFKVMYNTSWIAMEGEPVEPGTIVESAENPSGCGLPGNYSRSLNGKYTETTLPHGSNVTFDFEINQEGTFRTLIFFDNRPLTFTIDGEEHAALYWKNNGKQMLEVPFTLPEASRDKTNILAITIPIALLEKEDPIFLLAPSPIIVNLS